MTQFFAQPSSHSGLGPWQAQALETSRQLEAPLTQIQDLLRSNTRFDERFVDAFAREHPITSLYFSRASLAAPFIEEVAEPTRDMSGVVAEVSESLAEAQKLSALYAEFVPKQARWQAELLLLAATQETGLLAQPLQDLERASQAIDRLAATGEMIPQLVERERRAPRNCSRGANRDHSPDRPDAQATVEDLRLERSAILQSLHDERHAFNRDLEVSMDRSIDKVDTLIGQRGGELNQVAERVAERLWQRVLQLAILLGVFVVAGMFALTLCIRTVFVRRPPPLLGEPIQPAIASFEQHASAHGRAA